MRQTLSRLEHAVNVDRFRVCHQTFGNVLYLCAGKRFDERAAFGTFEKSAAGTSPNALSAKVRSKMRACVLVLNNPAGIE